MEPRPLSPEAPFIFIAGHHRSGTSLLHDILREHPDICGFENTGLFADEGQHLQSTYPPAKAFGGPGKYIFHNDAQMDESHPLATRCNALKIIDQWRPHYKTSLSPYFLEKSPPNLIRTRFLQKLFPNSRFIGVMRHPLAVACATRKWSQTSIRSLVDHTLRGYEIFARDLPSLHAAFVIRYEDFAENPQDCLLKIGNFLRIPPVKPVYEVRKGVNANYFRIWENPCEDAHDQLRFPISEAEEARANQFGYSLHEPERLLPNPLLGIHRH